MSLDLRSGKPVWDFNKPRIARYKKLTKNIRSEVVVIGGGISGALLAYRLSNVGMQVTIIDSRNIGAGSTAASTAILSYEADVNLGELIKKVGQRSAVRAYRAGIDAINLIGRTVKKLDDQCEFRRRRSLYLASSVEDDKLLERECAVRQRYGFKVRMIRGAELAKMFSVNARCAMLSEDAGEVNPLKLTQSLIRAAKKKSARVFIHTNVATYSREGEESVLITDDGFQVRTRHVVFATGYETQQFLKLKGVKLKSTYAIASQPMAFARQHEFPVIWETARPYFYARATADSRIVLGGEDVNFVDAKGRDRLLPRKTQALIRKFRKVFPDVPWKLASSWTGTFAETTDGLPFIGPHQDFPGAQFALGYGGNGITFAALASIIVADLIRGVKNTDARIFRFGRPSLTRW